MEFGIQRLSLALEALLASHVCRGRRWLCSVLTLSYFFAPSGLRGTLPAPGVSEGDSSPAGLAPRTSPGLGAHVWWGIFPGGSLSGRGCAQRGHEPADTSHLDPHLSSSGQQEGILRFTLGRVASQTSHLGCPGGPQCRCLPLHLVGPCLPGACAPGFGLLGARVPVLSLSYPCPPSVIGRGTAQWGDRPGVAAVTAREVAVASPA